MSDAAVVAFGAHRVPRPLRGLTVRHTEGPADVAAIDDAIGPYRRLVVVGADADLAALLTRLLRAERLDIEVAYVPRRLTPATRVYRILAGSWGARRARRGAARRVPLIRDETGAVVVGRASWQPADDRRLIHGEAVVDDLTLFDGEVAGVDIEPAPEMPGVRASLQDSRRRIGRYWLVGRAVQLGSTGVVVVRDGVPATRATRRSTFYRNVEGWLLVR